MHMYLHLKLRSPAPPSNQQQKPNMECPSNLSHFLSSNLYSILGGVVALLVAYNLWKGSRKNKGPLVPEAAGGLPIIGHLHKLATTKQTLARTLADMADKHGSVFQVRLGVHPTVIICDQKAMKEVYTTHDILFANRPHTIQAKYIGHDYASMGFAPYGPYWRNSRKLATIELLSNHRTKMLNYVQVSEVNLLLKDMFQEGPKKIINMSKAIDHMVFNMMTRMVAGKRFYSGIHDKTEGRSVGDIVREFMFVTGSLVPGDLIPFLKWYDFRGIVKTMKRVSAEVDELLSGWIDEHRGKKIENDKKDFIDVMLTVVEDDTTMGFSRETIIKAMVTAMMIAGTDTTTVTSIWALSNLLNHRHVLERAQQELDEKVGRDRCVEVSDIPKLEYLLAIVKETLRLYPPGPLGVPRVAGDDCYISGYLVPKGTRLFPHLWKLHRDPNVWSDAEVFMPERFLTTKKHVDVTGQYFEYLPFGAGRRSCPGMNLAMQVLHVTLAKILQGFDLRTPSNEPVDMSEGLGVIMPKATPLEVVATPRLAPHLYDRD